MDALVYVAFVALAILIVIVASYGSLRHLGLVPFS